MDAQLFGVRRCRMAPGEVRRRPLPRVAATQVEARGQIARWLRALPGITERLVVPATLAVLDIEPAGALDPLASTTVVRAGEVVRAVVEVPPMLARSLAQRLLGGPDEAPRPRGLTDAERATVGYALAAVCEPGVAIELRALSTLPAGSWWRVAGEIVLAGGERHAVAVVVDVTALSTRSPWPPWPTWSDAVVATWPVVVASSWVPRRSAAVLRAGDVVIAERCAWLAVGSGAYDLDLDRDPDLDVGDAHATVRSGYRRTVPPDSSQVVDDPLVEVTVEAARVTLSLRQLADLAPGAVLPLGRDAATPCTILVGGRPIGAGELVEIDGELGIRIAHLAP